MDGLSRLGGARRDMDAFEAGGEDALLVTRGDAALCFLLNPVTRVMRVIDFRAGGQAEKGALVREVAARAGMRRAFVVAEREEAATWARLGFVKEATVPGFYKRSDAHILGMALEERAPQESAVRIRVAEPGEGEGRAERNYQHARRLARAAGPLPTVKLSAVRGSERDKAVELARRAERALGDGARFGRDAERSAFLLTARGGFSVLLEVEAQRCFGNALLELRSAPRGEKEVWMLAGGLAQLAARLAAEEVMALFAFTAVELPELAAAMLAAGFRRTGLLPGHLLLEGRAADAYAWSLRLGEPT
jgi:hypothetical protein